MNEPSESAFTSKVPYPHLLRRPPYKSADGWQVKRSRTTGCVQYRRINPCRYVWVVPACNHLHMGIYRIRALYIPIAMLSRDGVYQPPAYHALVDHHPRNESIRKSPSQSVSSARQLPFTPNFGRDPGIPPGNMYSQCYPYLIRMNSMSNTCVPYSLICYVTLRRSPK
jgi:hypothetical protein